MRLKEAEVKNYGYLAVKYDKTYERLRIFEDLLKEEPKLGLSCSEKERVCSLIREYSNFRALCNNVGDEIIILAFIFYVKLSVNRRTNLNKWDICRKYGLNERKYSLIITRLLNTTLKE